MARILISLISFVILVSGCAQSGSIFPELGDGLATPSAMAFDVAANRLYVVNSNAEVLYNWQEGTFQVYDITNPLAPVLLESTPTASFSGQIYLDAAAGRAYVPNRYSPSEASEEDRLYTFDVDDGSANFGTFTEQAAGRDAYAIDCCYPADRVWISTSLNEIQYFDLTGVVPTGSMTLNSDLDTGGKLTNTEFNHIARVGNQAFLSREYGGVLVVNLDKAGQTGANALDYWIGDVPNPRGIATDGTNIYVVGEGNECGEDYCRFVEIIRIVDLVPRTGNINAIQVDKDDSGILVATIEVGKNPQEILLSTDYIFVTNQDDNTLSVINRSTLGAITPLAVGEAPFSLALYVTPAGEEKYLYVGNAESNTISIVDIPTLTVVATYPQ